MALSLSIKGINDTAEPQGLAPKLPVYEVVPKVIVVTERLPKQVDSLRAMRLVREEMTIITANERMRLALIRNIPAAADKNVIVRSDVLTYRENHVGKCVGLYVVSKRNGKILELHAGDRMIDAYVDKMKLYYENGNFIPVQSLKQTNCSCSAEPDTAYDDLSILDWRMPEQRNKVNPDEVTVDEFVAKVINEKDERTLKNDFTKARRREI